MHDLDDIYKITESLYIGAYWPRLNFKKIEKEGISAIVNLMEENLYTPPSDKFEYLYKGFPDETYPSFDIIADIFNFLDYQIKKCNKKVLVHCAMGISRSGAIVTGWILKENPNWSWTDAFEFVNEKKPIYPAVQIREAILDFLESKEGKRRLL
ncbi:MAG: dual specificity protein phosphatase family protein [Promethearchaeia archaeon]